MTTNIKYNVNHNMYYTEIKTTYLLTYLFPENSRNHSLARWRACLLAPMPENKMPHSSFGQVSPERGLFLRRDDALKLGRGSREIWAKKGVGSSREREPV